MRGTDAAPRILEEGGLDAILERYTTLRKVSLPAITQTTDTQNKYAVLADYLQQVKQTVVEHMRDSLPFLIGGDHAVGLGSVAAAAETYDDLAVIWFDAHGDMNTEETSLTGHIHGMPLAAAMGLCRSELNQVAGKPINPAHIFWVGTRSLDEGESALAQRLQLHVYSAEQVRQHGMKQVMAAIREEMQGMGLNHLHCSIDVDAMDPSVVCATGVKEDGGLQPEDYTQFIEALAQLPVQLTSLDWVEYNPLLDDPDMHTQQWCLKSIDQLMKAISE